MSGSITFRSGPFQGWALTLYATYDGVQVVRTLAQFNAPYRMGGKPLSGLLTFAPGIEGFGVSLAAVDGGPKRMADLLGWVIEANREALARRTDIPADQRAHWQAIVDRADESRADFFARYPDGVVPAFEVVGRLTFAEVRDLADAR